MSQWAGLMGQCIAENCEGRDVNSFLASSLCSVVGANTLIMPEIISDALSSAAGTVAPVTTIEGEISWVISRTV